MAALVFGSGRYMAAMHVRARSGNRSLMRHPTASFAGSDNAGNNLDPTGLANTHKEEPHMSETSSDQPNTPLDLHDDPVEGAEIAEDYPHDPAQPNTGKTRTEVDFERTRSIPDGSRGGRFGED